MSFVFHSLWTVSSGRERQYSGSRIAFKTENKRELYEFFFYDTVPELALHSASNSVIANSHKIFLKKS